MGIIKSEITRKNMLLVLLFGILGAIFMASSDWLMIYGDTSFSGNLAWLTNGVANISPERNLIALALAIPAVIFYAIGLFGVKEFITLSNHKKTYSALTAIGLTPWLAIHLLYTMILFLFGYLMNNGFSGDAVAICEALFAQFAWFIPVTEVLMLLPFFYLFYLFVSGKTGFSKLYALNNPIIIFIILKALTLLMPDAPYRLAFTNGLMSEAMIIWFLIFIFPVVNKKRKQI